MLKTSLAGKFALASVCAPLLAACAGTALDPVASLSASNAFAPSGYSETKVSDTQYKVNATGTEVTPKTRIEKIARARAAQIAVEQRMNFYKVASVAYGVKCSKGHEFYKGGSTPPAARQTVQLDVLYAKEPVDEGYVSAKESFEALSAEIAAETIPPEAKSQAEQEARAGCGQAI